MGGNRSTYFEFIVYKFFIFNKISQKIEKNNINKSKIGNVYDHIKVEIFIFRGTIPHYLNIGLILANLRFSDWILRE